MEVDVLGQARFVELPALSWQYDMRREKQEILKNIFLGPYQSASKSQLHKLLEDGITHILCVRGNIESRCVKVNFPQIFKYKVIEFRDDPFESIIRYFPEARDFINECLDTGGKVLIHGVNGLSRSAALLIAYIMEKYNLSYKEAFQTVRKRRYCIDPNYGFRNQLQEYEPIYQARSMLAVGDHCAKISVKRRASAEEVNEEMDFNENFAR